MLINNKLHCVNLIFSFLILLEIVEMWDCDFHSMLKSKFIIIIHILLNGIPTTVIFLSLSAAWVDNRVK